MIPNPSVQDSLLVLQGELADLERYAREVSRARFETEPDTAKTILHSLYLAAQATIDVAAFIAASQGRRAPTDYRDIFSVLNEAGILDQKLAQELSDWASFRNVIAHLYTKLDMKRVHQKRTRELDPLKKFAILAATLIS